MPRRHERSVQHPEIINVEDASVILGRHLLHRPVGRGSSIVHPGIETAEMRDGARGDTVDIGRVRYVGRADRDPAAARS